MIAALEGSFERVVAEDLSRLSRGRNDVSHLYKKLKFVGVGLETVAEGPIADIHVGFKGAMNEMFLRDLADKTLRGNIASVLRGNVPGGVTYGYRRARVLDARGELVKGRCAIVPEQAAVVRDIFAWFVDGLSPGGIAAKLNGMGVLGARRGRFMADFRHRRLGLALVRHFAQHAVSRRGHLQSRDLLQRPRHRPPDRQVASPRGMGPGADPGASDCRRRCVRGRAGDCRGPGGARDERRKLLASRSRPNAAPSTAARSGLASRAAQGDRPPAPCSPGVCTVRFTSARAAARRGCLRLSGLENMRQPGFDDRIADGALRGGGEGVDGGRSGGLDAGAAVEARRARLRAEIAGAEARFDDWHRKTTEAVAALGAGNPPQALREWCAVNEDKMRQARLDAAWGRIALERLAPPSNPERVVGKFKDLVRRWDADPRDGRGYAMCVTP